MANLYDAASIGNLEQVVHLIRTGIDIEYQNDRGESPLYISAKNGHLEVVKFLVQSKANVKLVANDGTTILEIAAKDQHKDVVEFIKEVTKNTEEKGQIKNRQESVKEKAKKIVLDLIEKQKTSQSLRFEDQAVIIPIIFYEDGFIINDLFCSYILHFEQLEMILDGYIPWTMSLVSTDLKVDVLILDRLGRTHNHSQPPSFDIDHTKFKTKFSFGSKSASGNGFGAQVPTSGFGFGAVQPQQPKPTTKPLFGQPQPQQASGSGFGAQVPTSGFGFGQVQPQPPAAATKPLFCAAPAASSEFSSSAAALTTGLFEKESLGGFFASATNSENVKTTPTSKLSHGFTQKVRICRYMHLNDNHGSLDFYKLVDMRKQIILKRAKELAVSKVMMNIWNNTVSIADRSNDVKVDEFQKSLRDKWNSVKDSLRLIKDSSIDEKCFEDFVEKKNFLLDSLEQVVEDGKAIVDSKISVQYQDTMEDLRQLQSFQNEISELLKEFPGGASELPLNTWEINRKEEVHRAKEETEKQIELLFKYFKSDAISSEDDFDVSNFLNTFINEFKTLNNFKPPVKNVLDTLKSTISSKQLLMDNIEEIETSYETLKNASNEWTVAKRSKLTLEEYDAKYDIMLDIFGELQKQTRNRRRVEGAVEELSEKYRSACRNVDAEYLRLFTVGSKFFPELLPKLKEISDSDEYLSFSRHFGSYENPQPIHRAKHKIYKANYDGIACILKEFHLDDSKDLSRFLKESRTIAKLNHPNIIKIHLAFVNDQTGSRKGYLHLPYYPKGIVTVAIPDSSEANLGLLLTELLQFDQSKRPYAKTCLFHPYFARIIDENDQKVDCLICFDSFLQSLTVSCSAGHCVCKDCFRGYLSASLSDETRLWKERKGEVLCIDFACRLQYSVSALLPCLDENMFEGLVKKREEVREMLVVGDLEVLHQKELARIQKEGNLLFHVRHIQESILNLKCPRCHLVFYAFDGCFALKCRSCACGFCAWCLQDCGADAHGHVPNCKFRKSIDPLFGSEKVFVECHRVRKIRLIQHYLRQFTKETQDVILSKLKTLLIDLKYPNI